MPTFSLRHRWTTLAAASLLATAAVACKKTEPTAPATPPAVEETAAEAEGAADAVAEDTADALAEAILSDLRSAENKARDDARNPKETLEFFEIRPNLTVLEIGPGGGWYSEILAPYLAPSGTLIVGLPDPEGPSAKYRAGWERLSTEQPELFGSLKTIVFDGATLRDQEPESVDLVLAIRNVHGWVNAGALNEALANIHSILKPGGVLGVVAHRTRDASDPLASSKKGYLPQEWLITQIEAAGFTLDASSEINANPKDSADYENGVWALPPNVRVEGDELKTQMLEIGESDRMTLRFKKR